MIDSGDYDEAATKRLQQMLDRKERMGDIKENLRVEYKDKFENWKIERKENRQSEETITE